MTGEYKDPQKERDYMREYMRNYRQRQRELDRVCAGCSKKLTGRQGLYCGRKCRQHAYHLRHGEKNRARYRAWHAANQERSSERVRLWRLANPGRNLEYVRKWRNKPCPYCEATRVWPAKACKQCTVRYGCLCHDNPECGVFEAHTHCPCGIPVAGGGHYKIQHCQFCQAEIARLGVTFAQLFQGAREDHGELEAAA